jgi:B9 domain-containing protein 2
MAEGAEVYFVGRLIGSSGFTQATFCRWFITAGQHWTLKEGQSEGQTQVDTPEEPDAMNIWSHPIDVKYETEGRLGWPAITLEVWEYEALGRSALAGYGFTVLPMSPGKHEMRVPLWKPVGATLQKWTSRFCGAAPHLRSRELVQTGASRSESALTTETSGNVHLALFVILGNVSSLPIAF